MPRLALLAPLMALALAADVPLADGGSVAAIVATPLALDLDDPGRRQVGSLRYVRGWALTSTHPRFGGISAMIVRGRGVLALSDEGYAIAFVAGGDRASIRALPVLGSAPVKQDRDTEAMTRDPVTGRIWVATENNDAIWRFSANFARAEGRIRPPAMKDWPFNGGAESLVRLRDGRFLAIAEHKRAGRGARLALLWPRDPLHADAPLRLAYRPPAGCVPSDAAELPDGRIAVLNRCVSLRHGVESAVTLVALRGLRRGRVLVGREIARLKRPLAVDNFEAIAAVRTAGATHLWLASDDNLSVLQRTLLLDFILPDGVTASPGDRDFSGATLPRTPL